MTPKELISRDINLAICDHKSIKVVSIVDGVRMVESYSTDNDLSNLYTNINDYYDDYLCNKNGQILRWIMC